MTRKNKTSKTPVTWYGGRFPSSTHSAEMHLFLWGTLTKEIVSKVLPASTPDSALLELYLEATASTAPPDIVHLIDERLLPLGKSIQGVTLKSGKREPFLNLVAEVIARAFVDQSQTSNEGFGSYLAGDASVEEVSTFFSAAASFYQAKPWEIFTCSGFLFRLDAPALGLIDCLVHLEAFVSSRGIPLLVVRLDVDEENDLALEFEAREDVSDELVKEIDDHQWPLASTEAVPSLRVYRVGQYVPVALASLHHMRVTLEAVLSFVTKHRHLSLLPEVTPVTESLIISWLPEQPKVEITGPHPDFDFTPYEPSEREFNDVESEDDDFA